MARERERRSARRRPRKWMFWIFIQAIFLKHFSYAIKSWLLHKGPLYHGNIDTRIIRTMCVFSLKAVFLLLSVRYGRQLENMFWKIHTQWIWNTRVFLFITYCGANEALFEFYCLMFTSCLLAKHSIENIIRNRTLWTYLHWPEVCVWRDISRRFSVLLQRAMRIVLIFSIFLSLNPNSSWLTHWIFGKHKLTSRITTRQFCIAIQFSCKIG